MAVSTPTGGRWVTMHGTHVFINGKGKVIKGPSELVGKTQGVTRIENGRTVFYRGKTEEEVPVQGANVVGGKTAHGALEAIFGKGKVRDVGGDEYHVVGKGTNSVISGLKKTGFGFAGYSPSGGPDPVKLMTDPGHRGTTVPTLGMREMFHHPALAGLHFDIVGDRYEEIGVGARGGKKVASVTKVRVHRG